MTRALVCRQLIGEDGLEVTDVPSPTLGESGVRIAVRAASVNYPDVLVTRGEYQAKPELPFIVGSELAGLVAEVGPGVRGFRRDDRVLALVGTGAMATEVVVDTATIQLHRIPDSMSWAQAGGLTMTYGTAFHGLIRRGALRAGESVLVVGAGGGCGSAAVQIAKAAGAEVIAVAGGTAKCELARAAGADTVIDHTRCADISPVVRTVTAGRGVDVVFDPVGGEDIRDVLRCLAWGGRYLVIGFVAGIPVVRLNQALLKNISIIGVAYGASAMADPAADARDWARIFTWFDQGLVRPAVSRSYPLDDGVQALRAVYNREAVGKIVIEMNS